MKLRLCIASIVLVFTVLLVCATERYRRQISAPPWIEAELARLKAVKNEPPPQHCRIKNCAGKNGAGLNCFACLETAGRIQGIKALAGFTEKMKAEDGGGYPERIDAMLLKHCNYKGHIHAQGREEVRKLLVRAHHALTPICMTDFGPGRYKGSVCTMVVVLRMDAKQDPQTLETTIERACFWDPNWPDSVEWVDDPLGRICRPDGSPWTVPGWAVFLLGGDE